MSENRSSVRREGADELTLRAEVGTLEGFINVDHIEYDRWVPLVDADWHAFCQAIYKGIGGEAWEELYYHYRAMSHAAGVKKAKSPLGTEAKDRGEVYYDPARQEDIFEEKDASGVVGGTPQRLDL